MRAFLIIDLQNDFLPGGALAVPEGNVVIDIINAMQQHFDLVVATQDWHPADHFSFASNHSDRKAFDVIEMNGQQQVLWPNHCVQGSEGANFSPLANMNRVETIFRKGTNPGIDSYSGFYDNGHLKTTGLADYLRGRGVQSVYIAGLAADYCVYYSALDAAAEGFDTYVLEDATKAIDKEKYLQAKADMQLKGIKVINSNEAKLPSRPGANFAA